MKNKKILFLSIVFIIIVGITGVFVSRKMNTHPKNNDKIAKRENVKNTENQSVDANKNNKEASDDYGNPDADIVYYYGKECPHCHKVSKFLNENDIYNKVDFAKKEVWHNKNNGAKLMEAAKQCGIDPGKVGVPFLYAKGKCYIGDSDVIAYFKKEAGL